MNDLKAEFTKHAVNGYLGNSEGAESYAYLRASSERQVEEGSSFPRQIQNIAKAALRENLRVPFELIFFDDGFTGFEFEHRPALLRLRHEVKSNPRAQHLCLEDIDRLSRNADWQQGFLLEEFTRHQIGVHFFINPGSQLERYVRGYIAQEGMRKDLERMRMGGIYKAMDGRVTARRPRYGYIKTDPKDTHYILHPEESKVIRWIYEKLIFEGLTLHKIATWMNDNHIPTRFKAGFWNASTLYHMVTSPVYKGDFYANRVVLPKNGKYLPSGKPRHTSKLRPEAEWIRVKVPAIVTPEEWLLAKEALTRNAKRSARNSKKRAWLLAGFVKCAVCEKFTLSASIGNSKTHPRRYYGCASRHSEKSRQLGTACYTPLVHADVLERRVWEELERIIYDPEIIIRRLEDRREEEHRKGYEQQLSFVDAQKTELAKEKEKFEAAYKRDIYTLNEFEEKMKDMRGRANALDASRAKLRVKLTEMHSIEDQKEIVLAALAKVRTEVEKAKQEKRQPDEIPFELKRRILSLLVDNIWVNSTDKTFTIEGEIKGTFAFGEDAKETDSPVIGDQTEEFASTSSLRLLRCATCR